MKLWFCGCRSALDGTPERAYDPTGQRECSPVVSCCELRTRLPGADSCGHGQHGEHQVRAAPPKPPVASAPRSEACRAADSARRRRRRRLLPCGAEGVVAVLRLVLRVLHMVTHPTTLRCRCSQRVRARAPAERCGARPRHGVARGEQWRVSGAAAPCLLAGCCLPACPLLPEAFCRLQALRCGWPVTIDCNSCSEGAAARS